MTESIPLVGEVRPRIGKGGAREARRAGRLPAVIYGSDEAPMSITLDAKEIALRAQQPGFHSHVYEVEVDGAKHRVLARELQADPVTGAPLHLDLQRFGARTTMTVDVELEVVGEEASPGVKKGGMVNVPQRMVEVACLADRIPERIEVDISTLDIGDTIHAGDLALPEGVNLGDVDPMTTVVNIAPPRVEAEEAEEAAEETAAGAGTAGEA